MTAGKFPAATVPWENATFAKHNASGGAVKRGGGATAEFRVSLLGPAASATSRKAEIPEQEQGTVPIVSNVDVPDRALNAARRAPSASREAAITRTFAQRNVLARRVNR